MTEVERIVSRARRGRVLFVGAIAGICLVVLGAAVTFAIVVNFQQGKKLTRVEKTACAKYPGSEECQKVKRETDRARSIRDTCIAFWKVDYPCPKPGSAAARRVAAAGSSFRGTAAGYASDDEPAAVDLTPANSPPSQQGSGKVPQGKGGNPAATGGDEATPIGSAPPPVVPAEDPEPEPVPDGPPPGQGGVIPSTVNAAGNAVEQTGNAASHVLCTATSVLHPCPQEGP